MGMLLCTSALFGCPPNSCRFCPVPRPAGQLLRAGRHRCRSPWTIRALLYVERALICAPRGALVAGQQQQRGVNILFSPVSTHPVLDSRKGSCCGYCEMMLIILYRFTIPTQLYKCWQRRALFRRACWISYLQNYTSADRDSLSLLNVLLWLRDYFDEDLHPKLNMSASIFTVSYM